jgi:alanyl aminopeptidase
MYRVSTRRLIDVLLIAFLVSCGGTVPPPPQEHRPPPLPAVAPAELAPPPREDGRLPPGVRPTRYALDFTIDPSKSTFVGRTRIGVVIAAPTRVIVLHGRDLTIRAVAVRTSNGAVSGKARARLVFGSKEVPEELVLEFDRELPAGELELDLAYEAPFGEQLVGLYRVKEGGADYAFTQFEAIDARRAFPCFDEPGFKTPYEVTITVPKGLLAVANTSEVSRREETATGLVTFAFAKSLPLPTYLVAMGVGPFDIYEGPKSPVPIRVIAAKGKGTLGKFAAEAAAAHLDRLGRYFDRPYPYGKLDLLAVPNFAYGAMENAGLVTFREELVLLDPERASTGARLGSAGTIAHELSHQWFGNLVTLAWWDDIWLNESFTTWISAKIVDEWRPDSNARLEQLGQASWAMGMDALAGSNKIRVHLQTAREIRDAGDVLVFYKGAAVLGMIEGWLGEDAFRDGMRRYVKKHEGGNVTSADLYAALAESSGGRDVAKTMDTFTDQNGVPVISAELHCPSRAAERPSVRLRQEEYRTLDRKNETSDKRWRIPVCVLYDAEGTMKRQCTLLDGAEGSIELDAQSGRAARCPSFFYPNAGELGYYRVRLARSDLDKLSRVVIGKLSERERVGLVGNAWAAVWSGDLPAAAYLAWLRNFQGETSGLVWGQIIGSLREADRALVDGPSRVAFAKLVRELLSPAARRLGFVPKKDEPSDRKLSRSDILFLLGDLGEDPWVLSEAKRIANAWLADPTQGDPDIASLGLLLTAHRGDAAMFDAVMRILGSATTPDVRQRGRRTLAAFDDPKLVERALGLLLDGTLKTQDIGPILFNLTRRKATVEMTYRWIEKHIDELSKNPPPMVPGVLARTPATLCNAERVRAMATSLRPHLEKIGGLSDLNQAVETGIRCATLADKEGVATRSWLTARGKAP